MLWAIPLDLRSREKHPLYRAAAVPEGSVRAPNQQLWLAAVRQIPEFAGLRADALTSVLAIAEALAHSADWSTMLSRPTHDALAARAEVSRRTVARVRARLEAAGLIGIVTSGRTSDPVDPDAGRLAQAYVLTIPKRLLEQLQPVCEPGGDQGDDSASDEHGACSGRALTRAISPVDETVTPSRVTSGDSGEEPPHARETPEDARYARGKTNPALDDEGRLGREAIWPTTRRPATRLERHLAAAEARRIDPILRRVSTAHVAALAREWHLAGWTLADIRWALEHRPDGSLWPHSLVASDVRHVPGWVRHRLMAWRADPADPASPPAQSRSQLLQAARAAVADTRAASAVEDAATAAAALPAVQVEDWTTHRAQLAARVHLAAAARRRQAQQATNQNQTTAPAPPAAPPTSAPSSPARRPVLRPIDETTDPRIANLRAAARAARRPR